MKRLYSLFVFLLLLLAAVAGIGWIYSLKHAGSYHWDRHVHPFFDEQSDRVEGYASGSDWALSWGGDRMTLRNEPYSATDRGFGYSAPPGFPMDEFLEGQYKRNWNESINAEERALKHHGFDAAMADVCNHNTWWGRRGFGRDNLSRTAITAPAWPVVFLLLILPAFRLIAVIRRRNRVAHGHCLRCGYDLRASSGRCPECGLDSMSQRVTLA